MKKQAPNIVLIMTDQQSAGTTSYEMGGKFIRTPAMDRIAGSGLSFDHAYCAHPLCGPSRTSMFSGYYPHQTQITSNGDFGRDMKNFPCMGSLMKDAGYDTGYVGKWHLPYPVNDSATHGFRYCTNNLSNGADLLNSDKAIEFLQEPRTKPFFLVASYNNPHNICEWARGKRGALPDGAISEPPPLNQLPPIKANSAPQQDEPEAITLLRESYQASPTFPVGDFDAQAWREYLWAYYRMIEHVDHHIGTLLDSLQSLGLKENTVLIFLSDHGDAQGAHGWNQKTVLHDESTRVPCVISHPARIAPRTSPALIQTGVDLIPTLCDLASIQKPEYMPGQSMLASAADEEAEKGRPFIVSHTRFIQGAAMNGSVPDISGRMVRSKNFKYCVYDEGQNNESLVDMQTDPGETVNLARKKLYSEEVQKHRHYLEEFSRELNDPFTVSLSPVSPKEHL